MATVYEIITNRIIDAIERGAVLPWRKTWKAATGMPRNLVTGKAYRGINVFLLAMVGFSNPYFLTFKQCRKLKGKVKKGSKGCPVVFWKWPTEDEKMEAKANGKTAFPICRYYTVFNVEQCEGITSKRLAEYVTAQGEALETTETQALESAEKILANWHNGCPVEYGHTSAFYVPSSDRIGMPNRETFETLPAFYLTQFHEMGHATGHHSRLNRFPENESVSGFGSDSYSSEELVAEMCAAFLGSDAGIDDTEYLQNSTAYVDGWLKRLKGDSRLVVLAAAKAQKAADSILGKAAMVSTSQAA